MARTEKIEGCDNRALLLTDTHLQAINAAQDFFDRQLGVTH